MRDGKITLTSIEIRDGNTFVYHYETDERFGRFLSGEPLWARYEENIKDIPAEIAVIPFLGLIAPIIWFCNGELNIDILDETYAQSLDRVKLAYQSIYPRADLSGKINIKKRISPLTPERSKKAVFFTGGVDSMATALTHKDERPLLISIWGSEARTHQKKAWEAVDTAQKEAAEIMALSRTTIASNYRDIMNQWVLEPYFPGKLMRSWYVEIAYGSIFLGLAAPLAWREGIDTIYFAAGFTGKGVPDGAAQALVEQNAWSGTRVVFDGMNEERFAKLERITRFDQFAGLKFNVCTFGRDEGNCSVCEKCSRAMASLALMGVDPSSHGFMVKDDTPERIRKSLENDEWPDFYAWQLANLKYWQEIQERVPMYLEKALPGWKEFFEWLSVAELSLFFLNHPPTFYQGLKTKLKRWLPFPVYRAVRQLRVYLKKL